MSIEDKAMRAENTILPGEPCEARDAPLLTPHVLVVDDECMILKLVAGILLPHGLEVSTAENGDQAVDLIRRHACISVTILDWQMPGMSGEQVFDRIAAIRPDLKVIVISGDSRWEVERAFAGRDVIRFLPKPFKAAALVSAVKSALAA